MTSILNSSRFLAAAGVVGATVGGTIGAASVKTQFMVYEMGALDKGMFLACQSFSGYTHDKFVAADVGDTRRSLFEICQPYEVYDWSLLQMVPVTLAAAIAGAFIVLVGLGILRQLYR